MIAPINADGPDLHQDLIVSQARFRSWGGFLFAAVMMVYAIAMNAFDGAFDGYGATAIAAVPLVYWLGRNAIKNPPELQASEQGLRFLGGKLIPWHAVKRIKVAPANYLNDGLFSRAKNVSFYFHQSKTILQLPLVLWANSVTSYGTIDAPIRDTTQSAADVVAQLNALHAHSLESGDSVVAASLPVARIHHQD